MRLRWPAPRPRHRSARRDGHCVRRPEKPHRTRHANRRAERVAARWRRGRRGRRGRWLWGRCVVHGRRRCCRGRRRSRRCLGCRRWCLSGRGRRRLRGRSCWRTGRLRRRRGGCRAWRRGGRYLAPRGRTAASGECGSGERDGGEERQTAHDGDLPGDSCTSSVLDAVASDCEMRHKTNGHRICDGHSSCGRRFCVTGGWLRRPRPSPRLRVQRRRRQARGRSYPGPEQQPCRRCSAAAGRSCLR